MRYGVRRFEHLAGIQRMKIGEVVVQANGEFREDRVFAFGFRRRDLRGGKMRKTGDQRLHGLRK